MTTKSKFLHLILNEAIMTDGLCLDTLTCKTEVPPIYDSNKPDTFFVEVIDIFSECICL